MKNFKSILGVSILSIVVFASCQKQEVKPAIASEVQLALATYEFDNVTSEEMDIFNALTQGETPVLSPAIATKSNPCAVIDSMSYNPYPFPPYFANLNIQYKVDAPTQYIIIKHWKKVSGSYVYQGESTITSTETTCTSKGVNFGSPYFSDPGDYLSWARMYDDGVYQDSYQILSWTHNP